MSYPSAMREKLGRWDDYVYRVALPVYPETRVVVMHFGVEQLDTSVSGTYDSADALPDWIKERLAILMMTREDYPTVEIPTVGRRISAQVFWVFGPETPAQAVAYLSSPYPKEVVFPEKAPPIDLLYLIMNRLKERK